MEVALDLAQEDGTSSGSAGVVRLGLRQMLTLVVRMVWWWWRLSVALPEAEMETHEDTTQRIHS